MTLYLVSTFQNRSDPILNIEVSLLPLSYDEKQMKAHVKKKEDLYKKRSGTRISSSYPDDRDEYSY